jgi:hypothetical protein
LLYQYRLRLLFPQGSAAEVVAIETLWPERNNHYIQCCIGRDVLRRSLLIYNGMTNMFSLIF